MSVLKLFQAFRHHKIQVLLKCLQTGDVSPKFLLTGVIIWLVKKGKPPKPPICLEYFRNNLDKVKPRWRVFANSRFPLWFKCLCVFSSSNNMALWIIIFNEDNVRKLSCYVVWFIRVRQPSAVPLLTHSPSLSPAAGFARVADIKKFCLS